MDKEISKLMRAYSGSPDAAKKDRFIRKVRAEGSKPEVCYLSMLKSQMGYIRPYIWILSLAVITISALRLKLSEENVSLVLSCVMPFFAGFGFIESFRARAYGMYDLEMSTLYSAKGTFYAKLTLIGILHLLTVTVSSVIVGVSGGGSILMEGVSLCIPYLITSILCMETERTSFGRDNSWSSLGVALLVAILRILAENFKQTFVPGPAVLCIILAALAVIQALEIRKTVRTEEYAWN